jgi:glycosyltransferase involved in cell wall biosynthesis
MMALPLVSIIIPSYNSEKFIAGTIESALGQVWQNKEVIVIDDGSIDHSFEIAKSFESENVKVFRQENKGASAARNRGLIEVKGDYIQFLDADDLLDRDKIEKQVKAIGNDPFAIAYGSSIKFNDGEDFASHTALSFLTKDYGNGKDLLFDLYGGNSENYTGGMVPLHAWLTPAQFIKDAGNWEESLTVDDDGDFFCRVLLKAKNVKYVDTAVCYYRMHRHNQNLSAQKSFKAYKSAFDAIRLKHQYLGKDPTFNILLANQAVMILNRCYPAHLQLCREMQDFIDQMGGNNWQPYQEGGHKILRQLFGWKAVKLLSYYKNKLVPNK